ncbi:unnamed protein product, partial [Brassica rapa]
CQELTILLKSYNIHDLLYIYLVIYTKHRGRHLTAANSYIDISDIIQAINYISHL